MESRNILFEQKMAEYTLLKANAEKRADYLKSKGRILDAKDWYETANRWERKKEELLDEAITVQEVEAEVVWHR